MQLFNIKYKVPYEGECTIHDCLPEEVLEWIENNSFNGYAEGAEIVPAGQLWYDPYEFVALFGKE